MMMMTKGEKEILTRLQKATTSTATLQTASTAPMIACLSACLGLPGPGRLLSWAVPRMQWEAMGRASVTSCGGSKSHGRQSAGGHGQAQAKKEESGSVLAVMCRIGGAPVSWAWGRQLVGGIGRATPVVDDILDRQRCGTGCYSFQPIGCRKLTEGRCFGWPKHGLAASRTSCPVGLLLGMTHPYTGACDSGCSIELPS